MVTKKIRTEYMKKFRDPKWDTFSKCYEDSLKYRLTRRVMEHSHKPWFWEGWDSGSDSSGWSTPKLTRNKIVPLSLPPPTPLKGKQGLFDNGTKLHPKDEKSDVEVGDTAVTDTDPTAVLDNGVNEGSGSAMVAANSRGMLNDTETDNGPGETPSSDEELGNPSPRRRQRYARSKQVQRDSSQDDKPAVIRKPMRAKSQPPLSTKENRRSSSRLDWTERQMDIRRTANDSNTSDTCGQAQRNADKRTSNMNRRRARSADLEKMRRSQLTVVDDRWMTEYMRCFSARLR
ncbi:centriole, cilia and spindle-associated protein [Antennarius striatus]|uniref:centriole, cilia and spindle-associated protein n=1 Tax=Antennarius striatus TaxID=241820 RepID=UPI0035ADBAF8